MASITHRAHSPLRTLPASPRLAVTADQREERERWIIETVGRLRTGLSHGVSEAGALVSEPDHLSEAHRQLRQEGVDWASFLHKTDDANDFPEQAVYNHTYWRWKQWGDRLASGAAIHNPPSAIHVDEVQVPDSAFFTNVRIESYTPEYLAREMEEIRPAGKVTITKPKRAGSSEGFFGKDERGIEYIFVFDPPFNPEMNTSAEFIGSTLCRMAGYRVPRTVIHTMQGTGDPQYDGRRCVATQAVKGYSGGWKYMTYKHRREIRGLVVFAAWLHNVDQTDHNTGISEIQEGVYLYYNWDYGASLGAFTYRPKIARLGWTYLWKPEEGLLGPWRRLGLCPSSWDPCFRQQSAAIGYFSDQFDPDQWKPFYPNYAFEEATEADRRWAAAKLASFGDEQIQAVVALAQFTHASDADYIAAVLRSRRDRILCHYLTGPDASAAKIIRQFPE
jgi:hypothetical protein